MQVTEPEPEDQYEYTYELKRAIGQLTGMLEELLDAVEPALYQPSDSDLTNLEEAYNRIKLQLDPHE